MDDDAVTLLDELHAVTHDQFSPGLVEFYLVSQNPDCLIPQDTVFRLQKGADLFLELFEHMDERGDAWAQSTNILSQFSIALHDALHTAVQLLEGADQRIERHCRGAGRAQGRAVVEKQLIQVFLFALVHRVSHR